MKGLPSSHPYPSTGMDGSCFSSPALPGEGMIPQESGRASPLPLSWKDLSAPSFARPLGVGGPAEQRTALPRGPRWMGWDSQMDGGSKAAPIHLKILFPPLRPPDSIEGDPSPPERGVGG